MENKEIKTKTILVTKTNGDEFQIDIPENWKVTFGPVVAGIEKNGRNIPTALRIYESKELQRAIFTDVISFRDLSIPMRVKKENIQEKVGFVECEGVRKSVVYQAKTSEWVNADSLTKQLAIDMPKDEEIFDAKV